MSAEPDDPDALASPPLRPAAGDAAGPPHDDPAVLVPLGDHCYRWDLPGHVMCSHWRPTEHGTVRCELTGHEEWLLGDAYCAASHSLGAEAAHRQFDPPSWLADQCKICRTNEHEFDFEDDLDTEEPDPDALVLRPRPAPRLR